MKSSAMHSNIYVICIHNYIVAAKKKNNGNERKMDEETQRNVIGNFQLQEVHGSKSLSK